MSKKRLVRKRQSPRSSSAADSLGQIKQMTRQVKQVDRMIDAQIERIVAQ